jgi:DNA (cytosine-5)-methyltransferase 1
VTFAVMDRVGFDVDAIDVFCGFGGSSQGIHAAGATVRAAANHNALALECHAANFPGVEHWQADMVDANDPQVVDRRGKKVQGRYLDPADLPRARFAWFSPGCTHHSPANAQKMYARGRGSLPFDEFDDAAYARSERSRVTMTCVLRYADRNRPEIVVVENVVEVCHWGPGRDGSTFAWWLSELRNLDYEIEPLFLNSQFFAPCPQSRDRIYIVAWRKGNRRPDLDYRPTAYCTSDRCAGRMVEAVQSWRPRTAAWPLELWGKYGRQYDYRCPDCVQRVDPAAWPAYTAIDWSNLGPSLGERAELGMKPLAPATEDRIRRGYAKFWGSPPIVIPAKSTWGVDRSVTVPFTAQTTQQDKALVNGGLVVQRTHNVPRGEVPRATEPAHDVTGRQPRVDVVHRRGTPCGGHTFERAGQTRARPVSAPLFTQHTHASLRLRARPVQRRDARRRLGSRRPAPCRRP